MGLGRRAVPAFHSCVMRIADAAKAAGLRRLARTAPMFMPILLLAAAAIAPGAEASLSGRTKGKHTVETAAPAPSLRLEDQATVEPARVRVAQASGGPLDGLFSIFKPKKPRARTPQTIEAPAAQLKKPKVIRPSAPSGAAESDFEPPNISVRPAAPKPRFYSSYRTMCVRLCDGYYWPVNSGTRSSSITRDRNVCEQSCQSETKLYIQYSLGADAGDMRDLSGKPYRKLKTAFLYRKSYDASCKCKPDPWSNPELMRHEEYRAAERGETLDEPSAMSADPDQTEVDAAVIRDTLASETDTPTEFDLVTGDGSSVGEERVATAPSIAAETTLVQKASLKKVSAPKPASETRKKKSLPKSTAPVLAPSDTGTGKKTATVKKKRDINARSSR